MSGNRSLARLLTAYLVKVLVEHDQWIALLVYAHHRGGASEAGLVAIAQLLPSIALGPVLIAHGKRFGIVRLLLISFAVEAVSLACSGVAILQGAPAALVYASAIVFVLGTTVSRPLHNVLMPLVVKRPGKGRDRRPRRPRLTGLALPLQSGGVERLVSAAVIVQPYALAGAQCPYSAIDSLYIHATSAALGIHAEDGDDLLSGVDVVLGIPAPALPTPLPVGLPGEHAVQAAVLTRVGDVVVVDLDRWIDGQQRRLEVAAKVRVVRGAHDCNVRF